MNLKNVLLANTPAFANRLEKAIIIIFTTFLLGNCQDAKEEKIDRRALVQRHNVVNTKADSLSSLSLGNGRFAFTVDVTGLQTFPEFYSNGIPLGTQSEWGWHSFRDTVGYNFSETLQEYKFNGKKISYPVQFSKNSRSKDAANWFRQNPHRLHLANIGFDIVKKDGSKVGIVDIQNIHQQLNLWTGEIKSNFDIEGSAVEVITIVHQEKDAIAVKVKSGLIKTGQLKIRVRFANPTGEWMDTGNHWDRHSTHKSVILKNTEIDGVLKHELDTTDYYVSLNWKNNGTLAQSDTPHYFFITPSADSESFELNSLFSSDKPSSAVPDFHTTRKSNKTSWAKFWNEGGAIDFSGSKDPRAKELERRIVLSQYLTKIQCAGSMPPQETGLTYNSWYGRPHLEMVWWHQVHFALWNRSSPVEKTLDWYKKVAPEARLISERQGFKGVRWQKMTDPQGKEGPSSVGSFLIWQQPHFIYLAELIYRERPSPETVRKYKDLVFATADFMSSYPFYDKEKDRYILGKGMIPAQECFDPNETFNPTYELAYWDWGLSAAIKWSERAGVKPKKEWIEVLDKLSPLPQKEGLYLASESVPDCYASTRYMKDHPAVLGALGLLPDNNRLDTATMNRTFEYVWKNWSWNETWGWDFPITAMNAARLGKPEKAIDALFMDVEKNTYLHNGHNYQDKRLRLYLPGNGGLLTAVAMMCAGWDGSKEPNPGFPKNGLWNVKWEGLQKMP